MKEKVYLDNGHPERETKTFWRALLLDVLKKKGPLPPSQVGKALRISTPHAVRIAQVDKLYFRTEWKTLRRSGHPTCIKIDLHSHLRMYHEFEARQRS